MFFPPSIFFLSSFCFCYKSSCVIIFSSLLFHVSIFTWCHLWWKLPRPVVTILKVISQQYCSASNGLWCLAKFRHPSTTACPVFNHTSLNPGARTIETVIGAHSFQSSFFFPPLIGGFQCTSTFWGGLFFATLRLNLALILVLVFWFPFFFFFSLLVVVVIPMPPFLSVIAYFAGRNNWKCSTCSCSLFWRFHGFFPL